MTREEAIDCINAIHVQMFNSGNSKWTEACDMAIKALKEKTKPFVAVANISVNERPHGEWIISSEYGRIYHCVCPRCSKDVEDYISGTENWWLNSLPNFCPDCGASMISSNSETEKSNYEKSCLNCGTSECELGNRARHGFCGNWTERK